MRLTDDVGRVVYERGREALGVVHRLQLEVADLSSLGRGQLTVGIPPMANLFSLRRSVPSASATPTRNCARPSTAGTVEQQVASGELEVGATVLPGDSGLALASRQFASHPIWVAGPRKAKWAKGQDRHAGRPARRTAGTAQRRLLADAQAAHGLPRRPHRTAHRGAERALGLSPRWRRPAWARPSCRVRCWLLHIEDDRRGAAGRARYGLGAGAYLAARPLSVVRARPADVCSGAGLSGTGPGWPPSGPAHGCRYPSQGSHDKPEPGTGTAACAGSPLPAEPRSDA